LPWVGEMVAMSHFSRADELGQASTPAQLATFNATLARLPPGTTTSLANSAALMAWPPARGGWVRPGLMLYGSHMLDAPCAEAEPLRAVMAVAAEVIAVRELAAGEPIGYAGTFSTSRPTRVVVGALDSADGSRDPASVGDPVSG